MVGLEGFEPSPRSRLIPEISAAACFFATSPITAMFMVSMASLELARPCGHQPLKLARIPIPPHRRVHALPDALWIDRLDPGRSPRDPIRDRGGKLGSRIAASLWDTGAGSLNRTGDILGTKQAFCH